MTGPDPWPNPSNHSFLSSSYTWPNTCSYQPSICYHTLSSSSSSGHWISVCPFHWSAVHFHRYWTIRSPNSIADISTMLSDWWSIPTLVNRPFFLEGSLSCTTLCKHLLLSTWIFWSALVFTKTVYDCFSPDRTHSQIFRLPLLNLAVIYTCCWIDSKDWNC